MLALLVAATIATAAPAPAAPSPVPTTPASTVLPAAARALQTDAIYIAPGEAASIDALAVRQAIPQAGSVRVAVLPASAAAEAGGEAAAVPGVLSGLVGRGGTVLVLEGNALDAASTTAGPETVASALQAARPLLGPTAAARTTAVTTAARLLSGGGAPRGLGEASSPGPRSAGNPAGVSGLIALAVIVVGGLLAVLLVPRLRRRQAGRPAPPPTRTVYVDAIGRVTGVQRGAATPSADRPDRAAAPGDVPSAPTVESSDGRSGKEDR